VEQDPYHQVGGPDSINQGPISMSQCPNSLKQDLDSVIQDPNSVKQPCLNEKGSDLIKKAVGPRLDDTRPRIAYKGWQRKFEN